MSSDSDAFEPQKFREHLRGFGHESPQSHEAAGVVQDEQLARFLRVVQQDYDPTLADCPDQMPGRAEELGLWQDIVGREEARVARESVRDGDVQTMRHVMGDMDQRPDVSSLRAIDTLQDMVSGSAVMFYLWAPPGAGKTNFALLLAELWRRHHGEGALLGSNIRTLRESDEWVDADGCRRDGWLASFGEMKEWLQQDGDPLGNDQTPKLFIFDEASSHAGGSGSNGHEAKKKMGPLLYKIRKYNGSIIVIGHDGKDVHPMIRELGVAVHKESKKKATFYEDVQNREGVNELQPVDGIPPTKFRYNDKEPTDWSWSDGESDSGEFDEGHAAGKREQKIVSTICAKKVGCSDRETSDIVGMSLGWVNNRWNEFAEDGRHVDLVNDLEVQTA